MSGKEKTKKSKKGPVTAKEIEQVRLILSFAFESNHTAYSTHTICWLFH